MLSCADLIVRELLFSNDNRDSNENVKQAITRLNNQNNKSASALHFFVQFLCGHCMT